MFLGVVAVADGNGERVVPVVVPGWIAEAVCFVWPSLGTPRLRVRYAWLVVAVGNADK